MKTTTNSKTYHFSDFTYKNYTKLLNIAKNKFIFCNFNNFKKRQSFILLRHDVDYSMHDAYKLSQVEFKNDIRSTYFIDLHNKFYNLMDLEIIELLKGIISSGHSIGLHFNLNFYKVKDEEYLIHYLKYEKKFLSQLLNTEVSVFSFHNPDSTTRYFNKFKYAGMVNTYSDYFIKNVSYCTDSNGYWRYNRLIDILKDKTISRLQLLIHPVWWKASVMSPQERLWSSFEKRTSQLKRWYLNMLKETGRKSIEW